MDNLKCLSDHVSAHASVDFIDACKTLRKKLLKSMKIAKKFKEELKLANLEKDELVVRLDESNKKKNEFLRTQISSQDEKMKNLEQELIETKSIRKHNRNNKPTVREYNKSIFVPTCHLCGIVGHIRPNPSLLRQKPKSETKFVVRNTDVPKFVSICHFCGVFSHIHPNCHKLKFKHSIFQFRICDDISPAISRYKLFHILLKKIELVGL